MNSAAAIIEALNSREAPGSRLRQAALESWVAWVGRSGNRRGRVTGAPAADLVAEFLAREPVSPPPRALELNRWRAFATLWRQNWHPATSDERRWRWTAGGVSFGWHVLLAILLIFITALNFVDAPPVDDESAVPVEFIGVGTPAEEGGGPAPSPAPTEAQASPAAAASPDSASAATTAATPSTPPPPTPLPAEQAASVPTAQPQPLAVTTPVSPEPPTFVIPPTSPPVATVDRLPAPAPSVRALPVPDLTPAPEASAPAPVMQVETIPAPSRTVAVREVPIVQRLPTLTAPRAPAVEPRPPAATVATQPAATSATSAAPTTSPAPAARPGTSRTSAPSSSTSAGPTTATPSAGVGTGPKPTPSPGSWATPRRGDDWGQSDRNRPGSDLFDGDGRPRIANGPGSASAPHPPGMITQEIRDIDRAGTWLRRRPFPYEPTRWDRLWKPNATLLDDWVEKGVKQVGIPIPGTNKKIICVISILQLGGGCGVSDPNLNEQPATARPPPDVPFKPQLQEGNGATWDKDGKAPPLPKLPGLFAPPKSGTPPGAAPDDDRGSG